MGKVLWFPQHFFFLHMYEIDHYIRINWKQHDWLFYAHFLLRIYLHVLNIVFREKQKITCLFNLWLFKLSKIAGLLTKKAHLIGFCILQDLSIHIIRLRLQIIVLTECCPEKKNTIVSSKRNCNLYCNRRHF